MNQRTRQMPKQSLAALAIQNASAPKRLEVINEAGGTPKVYLYDVISAWWGVSAEQVVEAIDSIEGDAFEMHINSPGGDVFEAKAIVAAMRASGKHVTTVVDGLAASSASWIATAGNRVLMAAGSFLMIHKSWTIELGNADDLRKTAGVLDQVDASIAAEYARRAKGGMEAVQEWMADDTWIAASDAVEYGLADEELDADGGSKASNWRLDTYNNVPKALTERPAEPAPERDLGRIKAFGELVLSGAERRIC